MVQINTAVVGFGLSGKVFHTPFLEASELFELTTIVQRSGDDAAKIYPTARIERSFTAVLEDDDIEVVAICTPNLLHFSMAKEVLLAGKHVIIEKPFVATSAEGEELIELAEKLGKHIFVFHNRRWDGDFKTVQKVMAEGMLGEIVSYEAHYDRFAPLLHAKGWKEVAEPTISILHDLGTHIIDQAVCLFGKPESVTANVWKQRKGSAIVDAFDIRLGYENIAVTLKSSLLVRESGPRYVIHGHDGSFVKYGIDPQEDDLKAGETPLRANWGLEPEGTWGLLHASSEGKDYREKVETLPGNYMGFYDNVAEVIQGKGKIAIPPQEALVTVKIIEASLQSHEEGRTLTY